MNREKQENNYRNGMIYAIVCAVLWGLLPVYWQSLRPIPSSTIIFYRIFLVGAVSFFAALKTHGWAEMKKHLGSPRNALIFAAAGVLITGNWSIYIWAVNADHVIQTSIGYYIEPLVVCIFGIVLFREKLTKYKLAALLFAAAGVLVILLYFREIPMIALGLALTFAIYAAVKKSVQVPAILSLLYETMFLMPIALAVIIYLEYTGKGALAAGEPYQFGLLLLSGVVTAVPLGLFAAAANRIPLVSLGVTEYISPSLSLMLGVFLFHEPFDKVQFAAFCIIWFGLVIFTLGEARDSGKDAEPKIEKTKIRDSIEESGE